MRLTLLGNPNTGKTSIFNLLTSQNNKVANFSGVTVYTSSYKFYINNQEYQLVDLPGVRSISSFSDSKDEIIVSKYIEENKEDIYLNVISFANFERSLLLSLSAIQKKMKVILVLNMHDITTLSQKESYEVKQLLEQDLGVPVVLLSAKKKKGIDDLKTAISNYTNTHQYLKLSIKDDPVEKTKFIKKLVSKLPKYRIKYNGITGFLDKIFLNNILSIPLFLGFIYLILFITMNSHMIFSGLIDELAGIIFIDLPRSHLSGLPEILQIILFDGVGGGIQTMLTFIPIIFTLFFLLSTLEQSGYMARQAFIADGVMQKLGLPGKAFVSLIMGLGCTVACSSGCRTLERESDRRLSLMISPSVSCSAKLPVYIYLCYICFGPIAVYMVFLIYFLGILFSVISGIFLSKSLFKTTAIPSIIDLPYYKVPSFKLVFRDSYQKIKRFIIGLGKTIVPIIAIITLFSSITFRGEIVSIDSNKSILAKTSSSITPLLSPMGVQSDNWQAALSLIVGFLAKEVVVGSMEATYFPIKEEQLSGDNFNLLDGIKDSFGNFISQILDRNYFDILDVSSQYSVFNETELKKNILYDSFGSFAAIFAFLLFILLYTPCVSAMGAIAREISVKWAWIVGLWSVFNAYMMASLFYQIATAPYYGSLFIVITFIIYVFLFFIFRYYGKKSQEKWNSNFIFGEKKQL